VLELGCGLGIPSLVAAARGARVLATDWSQDALDLLAANGARNGVELEVARIRWDEPERLPGPWALVLAADVLYEHRNVAQLLTLLERLGAEVLLAEPGRPPATAFFREARARWQVEELGDRVYRVRPGSDPAEKP
jgi:predicted nicotinamide N-methyase